MHCFEDIEVGRTVRLGSRRVTREEIVSFAAEFDPQPFHLDETAAREWPLGGLTGSPWHACAMLMRMLCDGYLLDSSSQGSPGLDDIRWVAQVRPDDTLSAQMTCLEARNSASRPDIGICRLRYEVSNQHGQLVMSWEGAQFFARRDAGGGS